MSDLKIDAQMRGYDLRHAGEMGQKLEAMGFDAVWTFEAAQDPFFPLLVAGNATERLELGTNIVVAFGRSPFATAQAAWDLQKASRGRFHLGLGTQVKAHVERRFSMPFEHPAARVTDYINCVRAIWDSFQNDTRPNYQGRFYQYRLISPFFNPGPIDHPDIPIYLAGVNPRMCRAAGEVADGFHAHPMHTVSYFDEIVKPAIDEGARTRGKTVDDIIIQTMVWMATGETQAELDSSVENIRREISFYGSTPNYRPVLEHLGYGEVGKKLSELMRAGDMDAMPKLVPDAVLEQVAVIAARPADAARKIAERYKGVLQRVTPYSPIPESDPVAKWKQFTDTFRQSL